MRLISKFGLVLSVVAAMTLSGCPKRAILEVSVETLRFEFDSGAGAYETVKTFTVRNVGFAGTELVFNVAANQPWISVSPATGVSTDSDDVTTVTVTIDRDYSEAKTLDFTTGIVTVTAGDQTMVIDVTTAPDYFTETFNPGEMDLDGRSFAFVPNGGLSFYEASQSAVTGFPTDPTPAESFPLDFSVFGDPARAGLFGNDGLSFFGESFDAIWIDSTGSVQFGDDACATCKGTAAAHFAIPQISGPDLQGASDAGCMVTYQQDDEKVTITYQNCKSANGSMDINNYQVELYFDGTVVTSFVDVDPTLSGVIGLSAGDGDGSTAPDDFVPSDFVSYNTGTVKIAL